MAHFYEKVPEQLRSLAHRDAVEEYAKRAATFIHAIDGLSKDQLLAHPVPGTWSIQQIVMHMMDTDLVASYRMKRIIAEDRPKLDAYDETAFADRLFYDALDARAAADVFRLNRLLTAEMLRALPEVAFDRIALHPEIGQLSLAQLIRLYCHHVDHHMKFLTEKRQMVSRT